MSLIAQPPDAGLDFAEPADAPDGCDLVVHTSATEAGLRRSLELKGLQSIIELADSREDAIARLEAARRGRTGGPEPELA